jgi:hypothetical protein
MLIHIRGKSLHGHNGKRLISGGAVWSMKPGQTIAHKVGREISGRGAFMPEPQYSQKASLLGIDVDKVRYPRMLRGGSARPNNIRLVL